MTCRASIAASNPQICAEIYNVTSKVDEVRGRAMVWVCGRVSHCQLPNVTARESVQVYVWHYTTESGWMCGQSSFIHGVSTLNEIGLYPMVET